MSLMNKLVSSANSKNDNELELSEMSFTLLKTTRDLIYTLAEPHK